MPGSVSYSEELKGYVLESIVGDKKTMTCVTIKELEENDKGVIDDHLRALGIREGEILAMHIYHTMRKNKEKPDGTKTKETETPKG